MAVSSSTRTPLRATLPHRRNAGAIGGAGLGGCREGGPSSLSLRRVVGRRSVGPPAAARDTVGRSVEGRRSVLGRPLVGGRALERTGAARPVVGRPPPERAGAGRPTGGRPVPERAGAGRPTGGR